jgi:anti-sigma factor RsiW
VTDPVEFELVPEMLSAYLDGELGAPERAAVEARLAESAEWRDELADVRAARDAVRNLPLHDAPAGFWDELLTRVADDDADDADDADAIVAPVVALESRKPRRRVAWFAAAAAIVVGLVAVLVVPHRSEVTPNVTAVVAQHGAQGSDSGDPISMLAPVGPLAGFRR